MTADTTIIGNLTDQAELRFTSSGKPVANFTVAVNKRKKDGNEWTDELVGFFRCSAWDSLAENVSTLPKGARVIVVGRLQERKWEKDGQKRSAIEVTAFAVGPDLKWATATLERTSRSDASPPNPEVATEHPPAAEWGEPAAAPAEGGF